MTVLLLLICCSLLLQLWGSVFVPCSVVNSFVFFLVLDAVILMGKREPVALLCLSSWCLVIVVVVLWLFLTVLWDGLQCVIVVFPDHTHLLFYGFVIKCQGQKYLNFTFMAYNAKICYMFWCRCFIKLHTDMVWY